MNGTIILSDIASPPRGARTGGLLSGEPLSSLLFDLVTTNAGQRPDPPTDAAAYYLVTLLERLHRGDILPARGETIAETFLAGLTDDPVRAEERLRLAGDRALLIAGLFPERFAPRLVTPDYLRRLGGAAFRRVARVTENGALEAIFRELASRFGLFVSILTDVGESVFPRAARRSILELYERWIATESLQARDALARRGVLPIASSLAALQ